MPINILQQVRRNHALEHATISLLSERYPHAQVLGLSGPRGFTLYTNLTAAEIFPAVTDALAFLKAGQSQRALHANCGTNLLAAATLTTLTTLLAMRWRCRSARKVYEDLPQLILLNALALTLSRPAGYWLQAKITTDAQVGNAEVASFLSDYQGSLRRIRVYVRHP